MGLRRVMTNPELQETVRFLKVKARENRSKIWEVAAEHLCQPRRRKTVLNLSQIAREAAKGSPVLVPGKVLGAGLIARPVVVGAFQFSHDAKGKIERAGGKCVGIKEFVGLYPKGSKVRILR